MTDSLPAPPELDPAALAASEFTRTRRGLEATEVRAALGRASDALRTWAERDARLRERIAELEERLEESHELDEQRIATVLGEETARIVTAARDAAAEIRTKAEEQAERLIRESDEQATAAADALRSEAQTLRDEAARLQAEAAEAATATRTEADAAAARVREEAEAAAATMREEAAALATSTVSDAQARADELRSAAETVLAERTAEAEAAAAAITAAAEAEANEAAAAAQELRDAAERDAAEVRAAAESAAEQLRAEAEATATALVDDATERGRAMVAEARAVRERMLRDLAERRRTARRQLEAALAGRDRIIEVLRAAGEEVAGTINGLDRADEDAAVAAEAAAEAVDDDLDAELADLQLGADDELEPLPAPDTVAETQTVAEPEVVEEPETVEESVTVEEPVSADDAGTAEDGATVHDLFARIRAEGTDQDEGDDRTADDDQADDHTVGAESGGAEPAATSTIDLTEGAVEAQDAPSAVAVDVATASSEELLFDRRDELLLPVEKGLARTLKRLASDEQNEILDRLRRVKRGRPDAAEILPATDDAPFVEALVGDFAKAVATGVEFWSEVAGTAATSPDAGDPQVREVLAGRVSEFLALHRAHLERAFAEADEADLDTAELSDRVRATYRDWRSGSLADLAGDLATAGFTLGERRAAGPGTPWRWVVDHGGLPCADGEDNALAGEVPCEEPFPTGDVTPPAHPGCRCILAPASR